MSLRPASSSSFRSSGFAALPDNAPATDNADASTPRTCCILATTSGCGAGTMCVGQPEQPTTLKQSLSSALTAAPTVKMTVSKTENYTVESIRHIVSYYYYY